MPAMHFTEVGDLKKQSFLKGSAVLLSMVFITKILGLAYKIPLTSLLGGSGMSCYSGAFAVFTPVYSLAAGGITGVLSSMISRQLALGRYKNAVRLQNCALLLFFSISAALAAALIFLSQPLAENLVHNPEAQWAIVAVAISLPFQSLVNVRRGWAEGLGSMNSTAASEIIECSVKLAAGLAAPFAVLSYAQDNFEKYHGCFGKYCTDSEAARLTALPYAAAASALAVTAASVVCCCFIFSHTRKASRECRREFSDYSLPLSISKRGCCKALLTGTFPAALTMLAATFSGLADLVTIAPCLKKAIAAQPTLFAFLSESGIEPNDRGAFVYGAYTGLALMVFGLLPTFTAMLGKSVLPSLSSAAAAGSRREKEKILGSMFLLSSGLALPGGVGICVLARPILELMFPTSHAEIMISARPLAILGIGVIFMGISLPCLTALQAVGKQVSAMMITFCGTAIKLALNILLIQNPSINISGAAISTVISQAVICAAAVAALIKGSGLDISAAVPLAQPLLPAFLCGCATYLTQKNVIQDLNGTAGRLGVLISVAFGSIICLISFTLLCISPKKQILEFFSKKIVKSP